MKHKRDLEFKKPAPQDEIEYVDALMSMPLEGEQPDRTTRAQVCNDLLNQPLSEELPINTKRKQRKQLYQQYEEWKLHQHNQIQGQIFGEIIN
jgi:hypothetical protein